MAAGNPLGIKGAVAPPGSLPPSVPRGGVRGDVFLSGLAPNQTMPGVMPVTPKSAKAVFGTGRGAAKAANNYAKSTLQKTRVPVPQARLNLPGTIGGTYSIKDLATAATGKGVGGGTGKPGASGKSRPQPASVASRVQSQLTGEGNNVTQLNPNAGNVTLGPAPVLPPQATLQTVPVPNLDPFAGRTPAQVALGQIQPQIGLINTTTSAEQRMIQGMAQAIMARLGQLPANVAQNYNQAQQTVTGLAQAAGNELAAANPNAGDQQMLQAIGAPQAQEQAVAGKLGAAFGGGGALTATTQGAIPAASLAASKAAAMQYANTLPAIQGLSALQADRNLAFMSDQQKMALMSQLPALENAVSTAKSNAAQAKFSDESTNNAAVAQNALARAGYAQNSAALGLKTNQQNFQNGLQVAKLNLDYKKLSDTELRDAANIGLKQGQLRVSAARFSSSSTTAQTKLLQKISAQMENWYYGKSGSQHFDNKTQQWVQANNGLPPVPYNTAIYRAVVEGAPYQAAVAMANAWYQPGEGGRPAAPTPTYALGANGFTKTG